MASWQQGVTQIDVRERLYIHASRQTLIAGQTLSYSLYAMSEQTGQLSSMSKLAYVQLVGAEGTILEQKIALSEGLGSGQIFISSLMPSGHYYLVANTRWMKNFESQLKVPITLINPFEEYVPPSELMDDWEISYFMTDDSPVAGAENSLVIRARNRFGINVPFKGKLMDQSNDIVTSFVSDQLGYASIVFTPKDENEYRVILEDSEQNFHFSRLPEVSAVPNFLQLKEDDKVIKVISQFDARGATLEVSNLQNVLHSFPLGNGVDRLLQKAELPDGLLFFAIKDESGSTLKNKAYYLQKHSVAKRIMEKPVLKNTQVHQRFDVPPGNYSVAVRKKYKSLNEESTDAVSNTLDFHTSASLFDRPPVSVLTDQLDRSSSNIDSIEFLPESMNELLSGRIINRSGLPVANHYLALSQVDQISQTVTSKSDDSGQFLFHFSSSARERTVIVTSLDSTSISYEFEKKFVDVNISDWPIYALDTTAIREVVELSLYNQIENIYTDAAKESVHVSSWLDQFEPFDFTYRLDDYTRFSTMREYFTEYILGARVRGNQIKVSSKYYERGFDENPLLLLDGVPVSAAAILDLNPASVETIDIVANRYYLGGLIADGLLSIKTYDSNFGGLNPNDFGQSLVIEGLNTPKEYLTVDYMSAEREHIPDNRTLLFWDSNIDHQQESLSISFFTSGIVGDFDIILQGISESGIPVTEIREFRVE